MREKTQSDGARVIVADITGKDTPVMGLWWNATLQERMHPDNLCALMADSIWRTIKPDGTPADTCPGIVLEFARMILAEQRRISKPEGADGSTVFKPETVEAIGKDRDRFYEERNYWMDRSEKAEARVKELGKSDRFMDGYKAGIAVERERIKQALQSFSTWKEEGYITSAQLLKILGA